MADPKVERRLNSPLAYVTLHEVTFALTLRELRILAAAIIKALGSYQ